MGYRSRNADRDLLISQRRVMDGWTLKQIGQEFGLTVERVRQICRDQGLPGYNIVALRAQLKRELALKEHLNRPCRYPGCTETVGSTLRSAFCAEHSSKRMNWICRSPESRANHKKAVRRWQAAHPEEYRIIANRAKKKYRDKLRARREERAQNAS